jgi:hypothetical protein
MGLLGLACACSLIGDFSCFFNKAINLAVAPLCKTIVKISTGVK